MNLQRYFEFIEQQKENPEKYHIHHIIPKYMGGSNDKSNLIKLSYENHCIAHIILAECFEPGSYHYNRNIWAALKLTGWKTDIDLTEKLSLTRKGKTYEELFGEQIAKKAKEKISSHWREYWNQPENKERKKIFMLEHNPMKNLKFSDVHIKKMSVARKKWWNEISDNDLSSIKERRSLISKKWWSCLSVEDKQRIAEKSSISMKKWWNSATNEIIKTRNKKISESQKGVPKNPEIVEKRKRTVKENKTFCGENNPMFGKKHSEGTKEKIRQKSIGRPGNRLGKTFSSFKFYCEGIFVYEAFGQTDARSFCKEKNISYQALCKKTDKWNNWYCKRNKKQNE